MVAGTTGPNVVDQCCLHAAMGSQVSIPLLSAVVISCSMHRY